MQSSSIILARISHTLPADVARALVPAVSRLISTRVRAGDEMSHASVGMSADAAGKSARATSSDSNTCEKVALRPILARQAVGLLTQDVQVRLLRGQSDGLIQVLKGRIEGLLPKVQFTAVLEQIGRA